MQALSWNVVFQIAYEIISSKYKEEFQVALLALWFVTELQFWFSCYSCYYVLFFWGVYVFLIEQLEAILLVRSDLAVFTCSAL